jgi:hypothetical protein
MAQSNLYGDGETSDDVARKGKAGTTKIDKKKQGEMPSPDPMVARYWREIERYERACSDWMEEGDEIIKVFLDENRATNSGQRKFALLWANVETLKPAVYTKPPALVCSRRHKDKDVIAKVCAEIMERCTNTTFDLYNVDEVFRMVRDDRLLPGRGQAWVRYEADIESYDDPDGAQDEAGEVLKREKLKNEKVCADHVPWDEFGHNVARTWTTDVWLVWRIVWKTKDEVSELFGEKAANMLTYNDKAPGSKQGAGSSKDDPDDRCKIYELWDKKRGITSWMGKGCQQMLDSGDPPLRFRDFFPCPEPCYATKTSKSLIPRPDYRYYRDQAKEINDLTEKIGNMTAWLIVKGFIPNGPSTVADPIEEVVRDKGNTELFVGVDSWQEFTERGGSAKLIDWLPIDKIVIALQAAIQARNQLIQDVFQITGISDILRGQTDPNETLGAQELKAQTGTRRLRNTKDEVARFCRDIGRLMAEVIAEKFEPTTLAAMSGYKYQPGMGMPQLGAPMPGMMQPPMMPGLPPPGGLQGQVIPPGMPGMPMPGMPPMMGNNGGPPMQEDDADPQLVFDDRHVELLRSDQMRNFRIDVETDSTVQADENAEKAARVEFITAFTTMLEKIGMVMQSPMAAPLMPMMSEATLYLSRGYRAGRGLEETIESSFKKMEQGMKQQAQQPSPEAMKAQEEAKIKQAELAQQAQLGQAELMQQGQLQKQELAGTMQIKQAELQGDMALAKQKQDAELQLAAAKQQADQQLQARKQTLDTQVKKEHNAHTAHGQAQDRIAKAMLALKPNGPGSVRH